MIANKELKELIKLLRAAGVSEFETPELKLKLRDEAPPSTYKKKQEELPLDPTSEQPYTDEQALFWSSHPIDAPDEVN